jgi:periplasmic copper chaperone A
MAYAGGLRKRAVDLKTNAMTLAQQMRSLAAAALLLAVPAQAATYTAGPVSAAEPWSRPAAAGTTGAGFLTLSNGGTTAETLVSVKSPVAASVEVHRSSLVGGVSRMERVERLAVPARGAVTLAPGGYHLMLKGLKAPLKAGQKFPATLTFASGRKLELAFTVSEGMGPPVESHHHH